MALYFASDLGSEEKSLEYGEDSGFSLGSWSRRFTVRYGHIPTVVTPMFSVCSHLCGVGREAGDGLGMKGLLQVKFLCIFIFFLNRNFFGDRIRTRRLSGKAVT